MSQRKKTQKPIRNPSRSAGQIYFEAGQEIATSFFDLEDGCFLGTLLGLAGELRDRAENGTPDSVEAFFEREYPVSLKVIPAKHRAEFFEGIVALAETWRTEEEDELGSGGKR